MYLGFPSTWFCSGFRPHFLGTWKCSKSEQFGYKWLIFDLGFLSSVFWVIFCHVQVVDFIHYKVVFYFGEGVFVTVFDSFAAREYQRLVYRFDFIINFLCRTLRNNDSNSPMVKGNDSTIRARARSRLHARYILHARQHAREEACKSLNSFILFKA